VSIGGTQIEGMHPATFSGKEKGRTIEQRPRGGATGYQGPKIGRRDLEEVQVRKQKVGNFTLP